MNSCKLTLPISVQLRVRGVVQGVGFRPFIYRLARRYGLSGWVLNDAQGVLIEARGAADTVADFVAAIQREAPPASHVEELLELLRRDGGEPGGFEIRESAGAASITTQISPDLVVCPDCLAELFDPQDFRYRYAYINCTNCGPRYSIILALPYDRPLTTMKDYPLCSRCEAEYHDPENRRFHAQPVACPACGPHLRYLDAAGQELAKGEAVINLAAFQLRNGAILAIKGLGGYHLACDATDTAAVEALRVRKFRKERPFALMARDLSAIAGIVVLDAAAEALLAGPARPIVLLAKGQKSLPSALAPDNAELGIMLPYTPLHHLLFAAGAPPLLVMTSANRSSEPIAYRDEEALTRLAGIADGLVVGERLIARRVDDSVVTIMDGAPAMIRRARGYAPSPVLRDARFARPILALGAGLKNAVALATGGYLFVSQHLGDLDNLDAFEAFQETVLDLTSMYRVDLTETLVVHDLHPDYPSSRYAESLPGPRLAVQHHLAHIASVLAEHGAWELPVIGFSFDGTGLGSDETIWGGEIICGSLAGGLERVGHLRRALLPGGDAAARHPEQAAVGFLHELDADLWRPLLSEKPVRVALSLIKSGLNTPVTSSMGRLFDAVAALCGFKRPMTFEGQAAIWLESLARQAHPSEPYPFPFDGATWDYRALLMPLLVDLRAGCEAVEVAYRFHAALAAGVVEAAVRLREQGHGSTVALSGGVWHNKLLHGLALSDLRQRGFTVWWNQQVPVGDGGIAVGQAALAAREVQDVSRHSV
jgi:hydrogenase maturation protein HypF